MRIKELFAVPEGTKITEKMFGRVLLSSILGIFLCMACLVSTTWAWFSVGIENTENKIVIATAKPKVTVKMGNGDLAETTNGVYELAEGEYLLQAEIESDATEADAFGTRTDPVYLIMTVVQDDQTESYFVLVDSGSAAQSHKFSISAGNAARVTFSVSWVQPAQAKPLDGTPAETDPTPEADESITPETTIPETTEAEPVSP